MSINQTTNPYSPPAPNADLAGRYRGVGHLLGAVGFLIGMVPSLLVLYSLSSMWDVLVDSPSTSVHPVGLYLLGCKWLAIHVFFGIPLACGFASAAERCGSTMGRDASFWSVAFCPLPLLLALFGPFVVVWATGSSFGVVIGVPSFMLWNILKLDFAVYLWSVTPCVAVEPGSVYFRCLWL